MNPIYHQAKFINSSPDLKDTPEDQGKEIAFAGRSNAGKSSAINTLTRQNGLARISKTPGRTQMLNFFEINDQKRFVDLPGYGYAKRSQSDRRRWEQMIDGYLRKRENLIKVFVLIDARHAPQNIDLEFVNQLDKWEVPFALVFTKADKEKPKVVERNVKSFLDKLKETWQFLPQSFVSSAEKSTGRDEILDCIQQCNETVKDKFIFTRNEK